MFSFHDAWFYVWLVQMKQTDIIGTAAGNVHINFKTSVVCCSFSI